MVTVVSETFTQTTCTLKLKQEWYLESGEKDTTGVKWFIPIFVNVGGKESLLEMNELEQE